VTAATFDFAVLGGGPAGLAAAALLAGGGARVVLIDAARPGLTKAGEFIHPGVKAFINRLAILPEDWERAHLPVHGFVNGWASADPQETDFIYNPHGPALALDRRTFERQLLEAAVDRGADARLGWTARDVGRGTGGSWRIALKGNYRVASCDARYLLMAGGRRGACPINTVQRNKFDRLAFVAVSMQGAAVGERPLIECFENGWVYATPVPGNARVIYVFFDARLGLPFRRTLPSMRDALKHCSQASQMLDEVADDRAAKLEWFSGSAHSGLARSTAGPNWCLLGDLAESRDPLTASGLFNALGDASRMAEHLLSEPLTAKAMAELDAERTREFSDYLTTRRSYYAEETRWSGSPFWSRYGGDAERPPEITAAAS
jgi:flavin-dependent dehydrogenase